MPMVQRLPLQVLSRILVRGPLQVRTVEQNRWAKFTQHIDLFILTMLLIPDTQPMSTIDCNAGTSSSSIDHHQHQQQQQLQQDDVNQPVQTDLSNRPLSDITSIHVLRNDNKHHNSNNDVAVVIDTTFTENATDDSSNTFEIYASSSQQTQDQQQGLQYLPIHQQEQTSQQQCHQYEYHQQPQELNQKYEPQYQHQQQQQQQKEYQFTCLYTKHKVQKKKIWYDGRLVIGTYFADLFSVTSSTQIVAVSAAATATTTTTSTADTGGNGCGILLDRCELSRTEIDSIQQRYISSLNRNTTNDTTTPITIETEKYIISIEGIFYPYSSTNTISTPATNNNSTHTIIRSIPRNQNSSMKKLLTTKYRRPQAIIPPYPQQQSQHYPNKRLRCPLQPGELIRRYYPSQQQQMRPQQQQLIQSSIQGQQAGYSSCNSHLYNNNNNNCNQNDKHLSNGVNDNENNSRILNSSNITAHQEPFRYTLESQFSQQHQQSPQDPYFQQHQRQQHPTNAVANMVQNNHTNIHSQNSRTTQNYTPVIVSSSEFLNQQQQQQQQQQRRVHQEMSRVPTVMSPESAITRDIETPFRNPTDTSTLLPSNSFNIGKEMCSNNPNIAITKQQQHDVEGRNHLNRNYFTTNALSDSINSTTTRKSIQDPWSANSFNPTSYYGQENDEEEEEDDDDNDHNEANKLSWNLPSSAHVTNAAIGITPVTASIESKTDGTKGTLSTQQLLNMFSFPQKQHSDIRDTISDGNSGSICNGKNNVSAIKDESTIANANENDKNDFFALPRNDEDTDSSSSSDDEE